MIYSFQNTTSYSTLYAFFSSFRIILWQMWLSNSKRQPCFYPPQPHTRRHTELTKKKLTNLMGNLCCVREHSVQFYVHLFHTVKQHSLTYSVRNPFRTKLELFDMQNQTVPRSKHTPSRYTNQSVNAVQRNIRSSFRVPHKTHKYTVWAERRFCES